MGTIIPNLFPPSLHHDPLGTVIDVHAPRRHFTPETGSEWVPIGPPMPLAVYQTLHIAATQGMAAFETVIHQTAWGVGYFLIPAAERNAIRRGVLTVPPLAMLPPG